MTGGRPPHIRPMLCLSHPLSILSRPPVWCLHRRLIEVPGGGGAVSPPGRACHQPIIFEAVGSRRIATLLLTCAYPTLVDSRTVRDVIHAFISNLPFSVSPPSPLPRSLSLSLSQNKMSKLSRKTVSVVIAHPKLSISNTSLPLGKLSLHRMTHAVR